MSLLCPSKLLPLQENHRNVLLLSPSDLDGKLSRVHLAGACRHSHFSQYEAIALFFPEVWENDSLHKIIAETSLSYRISIHPHEQLWGCLLGTLSKGRHNSLWAAWTNIIVSLWLMYQLHTRIRADNLFFLSSQSWQVSERLSILSMTRMEKGCSLHSENGEVSRWCWGGGADNSNGASNRGPFPGKAQSLTWEKASAPSSDGAGC